MFFGINAGMGILDNFFQQATNAARGGSVIVVGKCTVSVAGGGLDGLSATGDLAFQGFILKHPQHPPFPTPPSFGGVIGKTFGDNNFLVSVLLARTNLFDPSIPGIYNFQVEGSNVGEPIFMNGVSDPVTGFSAPQQNEVKFVQPQANEGTSLTVTILIA
jgi:hypothetical protein